MLRGRHQATPNPHSGGDTATKEPLSTALKAQRPTALPEHLRWHGTYEKHGFCGEPLSDGPFIPLTRSAEHLVCPECLTILRLYQRSGLWEGYGKSPGR